MNIEYSATAMQDAEDFALLREASERLGKVVGASVFRVSMRWDRRMGPDGRTLYVLQLFDPAEEVSATFTPAELRRPGHLRYRLLDAWGDFLQVQSAKQLAKVLQLVDEGS